MFSHVVETIGLVSTSVVWLFGHSSSMKTTSGQTCPHRFLLPVVSWWHCWTCFDLKREVSGDVSFHLPHQVSLAVHRVHDGQRRPCLCASSKDDDKCNTWTWSSSELDWSLCCFTDSLLWLWLFSQQVGVIMNFMKRIFILTPALWRSFSRSETNVIWRTNKHKRWWCCFTRSCRPAPAHSTETALLKVTNHLLLTTDRGESVIWILLDLSAAFNTIDHNFLIDRLKSWVGIRDTALGWFCSYLFNRTCAVTIGNHSSSTTQIVYGVPQGSIIAP